MNPATHDPKINKATTFHPGFCVGGCEVLLLGKRAYIIYTFTWMFRTKPFWLKSAALSWNHMSNYKANLRHHSWMFRTQVDSFKMHWNAINIYKPITGETCSRFWDDNLQGLTSLQGLTHTRVVFHNKLCLREGIIIFHEWCWQLRRQRRSSACKFTAGQNSARFLGPSLAA